MTLSDLAGESGKKPVKGWPRPQDVEHKMRWRPFVFGLGLVGVLAIVVHSLGGSERSGFEAKVVPSLELAKIARSSDHPIYWFGPAQYGRLEVSRGDDGVVRISYLREKPSGELNRSMTITSYPTADATGAIDRLATRKGSVVRTKDGRRVVVSTDAPNRAYYASPDGSVQIEVYAPTPQRAVKLALSGVLGPVPLGGIELEAP